MNVERLQKFLARSGVASRRTAEMLIAAGRIAVNGRIVTAPGTRIDPERDLIAADGRKVEPPVMHTYVMLHKPAGYVTAVRDPQGRPRVFDLLPPGGPRLHSVGRLDLDTTGLLLLTDDGELTQALTHPSRGVWKTYRAIVSGVPRPEALERFRRGLLLEDGPTAPAKIHIVGSLAGHATLEIELHEGRKRQIRRMCAAIGHPVIDLARIGLGPLRLGNLPVGAWRNLTAAELAALRRIAPRSMS